MAGSVDKRFDRNNKEYEIYDRKEFDYRDIYSERIKIIWLLILERSI
jgi:hypothetical protein